MNQPVVELLNLMLQGAGSDSLQLGNASIGLIKAPFTQSKTLQLSDITEADFSGYSRKGIGTPTVTFTGADGLQYIQGTTARFQPSDTVTVNTVYGFFLTPGDDTTKLFISDVFAQPLSMASPANEITITPRFGLNPAASFGMNVVSN